MPAERKYTRLDDRLYDYLLAHRSGADDPLLARLQEETVRLGAVAGMQIAPDQGTLLRFLTATLGARRALEVGTFTGYSAISIARGLAPGGRLLCCDVSEEWTAIARRYWKEAGLDDRIELRLAPAIETLRALPAEPAFDFTFVDADKESYPAYWEEIVPRTRTGGLIAIDNVFRDGDIVDPGKKDGATLATRALNDRVASDERVASVMIAVADGLTLARKR